MKNNVEMFVGIDVSKDSLDVYNGLQEQRVKNTTNEVQKLAQRLAKEGAALVVVESTGGYERLVVQALWEVQVPVAVVNPRQTKRFAQALAVEAKTDRIDARMLQQFASMVQPVATPRPEPEIIELQALLDRRRQIMQVLVAEKNRLKSPLASKPLVSSVKRVIALLSKELKAINVLAEKTIQANQTLRAKKELLLSEHGVGQVLALTILGDLSELGTINRAKITALVGLAPLDRQSGLKDGKRFIRGGRKHVRHVLYMATVAAIRRSKTLKPYFLRLVKRGKPKMIALIACMRRLLITLNAKMRNFLALNANTICCNT